jgi:epoxyqueuosine reductase
VNDAERIMERARDLFDVAGVASEPSTGDTILILGLVSTPERDLDDFVSGRDRLFMRGFARHAAELEDALIDFIRGLGYGAELVGAYGYPTHGELDLKHLAVAAGLGNQGKNTLVINSRFGPWLRFMTIRTDAPVANTGPGTYSKVENPDCLDCDECVRACPQGVLEPYRMPEVEGCLANLSSNGRGGLPICDGCVVVCPVGEREAA